MNREEFQTERTRIISEMLDNPDEYGIYPTTKCFEQLDALFDSLSLPPAEGAEDDKAGLIKQIKDAEKLLSRKNTPNEVLTKEQFTAIIEDSVKDIWYGRRSMNPVKEQTELLVEKLYPLINKPQPTAEGAEEIEAELRGYARDIVRLHKPIMEVNPQLAMDSIGNDLVKMFNRLAQRIAEKMVEEKWINVKDGLPEKDGKSSIYCLVNSKYDGIVVRPYNEYHKCWDAEDADDYYCDAIDGKITHWMPLPNPPIK